MYVSCILNCLFLFAVSLSVPFTSWASVVYTQGAHRTNGSFYGILCCHGSCHWGDVESGMGCSLAVIKGETQLLEVEYDKAWDTLRLKKERERERERERGEREIHVYW